MAQESAFALVSFLCCLLYLLSSRKTQAKTAPFKYVGLLFLLLTSLFAIIYVAVLTPCRAAVFWFFVCELLSTLTLLAFNLPVRLEDPIIFNRTPAACRYYLGKYIFSSLNIFE